MDMIVHYLPSPVDHGTVTGKKPGKDDIEEERRPEESAPFSAMVFKTIADPMRAVSPFSASIPAHSVPKELSITPLVNWPNVSAVSFSWKAKTKNWPSPLYQGILPFWQS